MILKLQVINVSQSVLLLLLMPQFFPFLSGQENVLILCYGDALYKKVQTNNDFLQVHEIGKEIYVFGYTFQISIENEYYGILQKDETETRTVGTTLEKVTYTMYHSLSQSK